MRKLVIGGIILIISLLMGTYIMVGEAFDMNDSVNVLTFAGVTAIVIITVSVVLKYVNQMKNANSEGELSDHSWDGIGEYKNKIPTGWGILFIATIIWFWYYLFIAFPINEYSQIGEYNDEVKEYNKRFEEKFKNPTEETLKEMGKSQFLVQCSVCHGIDGMGIDGKAHDLTKRISKEQVKAVIQNGANNFKETYPGGMPPMLLTEEKDIEEVSEYVANGLKGEMPSMWPVCAGCHGMGGEGMPYVAPNIKEYSDELIKTVLHEGKEGIIGKMPSFKNRLNETQEKAIANYLRSIGE